ncbi:aromatic acid exporter family protein [Streptomyces sp. NPDC048639]|uniref:FUSC family protein n=1 Tax=Streptomyces sp. NPDC048639 TaxID=3365581 RepID=UPI0037179149
MRRLIGIAPDVQLVGKATLAAGCAWWLSQFMPGHNLPYFAALAALLGVYPTVLSSLREGGRYAFGFLLGLLLGVPVAILLGPSVWGLLVVVPLSLLIAAWPQLDGHGMQVPFASLFVLLAVGNEPVARALPLLADVVLGVAVGLTVNAALPPALRQNETGRAFRRLGRLTAELLHDTAAEVRASDLFEPAHRARRALAVHNGAMEVADARAKAAESLRFNARARLARHENPLPANPVLEALYAAAEQARVITREVRRCGAGSDPTMLGPGFRARFTDLLDLLAESVAECGRSMRAPTAERLGEAQARFRELRAEALDSARSEELEHAPYRRLAEAQLCALVLQLLLDLVPEEAGEMAPERLGISY